MNMQALISVVIPAHNEEEYLPIVHGNREMRGRHTALTQYP